MKLSGNKGEWSELYVLLKLLSTGELYAADEKLQKIKDVYYPILKIIRQEDENKHLEYVIVSEEQGIEIHWNAEIIRSITQKEMAKRAAYLYEKIVEGGSRAFEIPGSDTIMNEFLVHSQFCCYSQPNPTHKRMLKQMLSAFSYNHAPSSDYNISINHQFNFSTVLRIFLSLLYLADEKSHPLRLSEPSRDESYFSAHSAKKSPLLNP